jgi:hypothetical protein
VTQVHFYEGWSPNSYAGHVQIHWLLGLKSGYQCHLQMILDGKLAGTLDAGSGCLEVFDEPPQDAVFPSALESLTHLGAAIDTLAIRSQKVMA